jgi:hypothetical protein
MVQVKVIYAANYVKLETEINAALKELGKANIRDIRIDMDWAGDEDHYMGYIIYDEA